MANSAKYLLLYGGFFAYASLSSPVNVVDLGYARYKGNITYPNVVAYLGIPYAEPPVGNGRWRSPVPLNTARVHAQSSGEVIDATEYPDFCVQGTTGGTYFHCNLYYTHSHTCVAGDVGGAGSEDCLKINVYTPAGTKPGEKCTPFLYCL